MTNPDNVGGLVWYVCTSCMLMVQLPSDTPTLGRCQCSPKGWSLRRAKLPKGYELCRAAPAGSGEVHPIPQELFDRAHRLRELAAANRLNECLPTIETMCGKNAGDAIRDAAALLARTEAGADECEVCKGAGTVDEMLGGYAFSNPKATCPECDGLGEYTHPKNAAPVADGLYAWVRESPRHWERVTESDLSQPADPQKMRADRWFPVYTHPHDASAREADRESLLSYKEIVHRLASTREGCIELAKVVHRELDFIDRCITDAIARCEAAAALPSPPKEKES